MKIELLFKCAGLESKKSPTVHVIIPTMQLLAHVVHRIHNHYLLYKTMQMLCCKIIVSTVHVVLYFS